MNALHFYSQGIARVINLLCENSLINTYVGNLQPVPAEIVDEVAGELQFAQAKRPGLVGDYDDAADAHSICREIDFRESTRSYVFLGRANLGGAVRSWAHVRFSSVCHRKAEDHSKQRVLQSCTSSLACERTSDRIGSASGRLRPLASTEGVQEETQHLQGSTEPTSERAFQLLCELAPKLPTIISVPRLHRDESRGDSPATGDFDPPRLHRALWVLAPRHPRFARFPTA